MKSLRSDLKRRASVVLGAFALIGIVVPVSADPLVLSSALDSKTATTQESNFGDLCADALLAAAPDADFALCPASEMRPLVIPAGSSTTEHLADSLRSNNDATDTVVVMQLTGEQVRAALAHGLSRAPGPFDGFLQVAGLSVHYDSSKHGVDRIGAVTVASSGEALGARKTYKVAMPHYLADGSLGYFADWADAPAPTDTRISMTDAVVRFAKGKQPVSYQTSGRIAGS